VTARACRRCESALGAVDTTNAGKPAEPLLIAVRFRRSHLFRGLWQGHLVIRRTPGCTCCCSVRAGTATTSAYTASIPRSSSPYARGSGASRWPAPGSCSLRLGVKRFPRVRGGVCKDLRHERAAALDLLHRAGLLELREVEAGTRRSESAHTMAEPRRALRAPCEAHDVIDEMGHGRREGSGWVSRHAVVVPETLCPVEHDESGRCAPARAKLRRMGTRVSRRPAELDELAEDLGR